MLISPTEPKRLRDIGTTNLLPERFGCDVLFTTKVGSVGIQRKELSDLVASVKDGRLGKELVQMRQLTQSLLIIEGEVRWTGDGNLLGRMNFTQRQFQGLIWSVQSQGCWITYTRDLGETIESVYSFEKWCGKHLGTSHISSLIKRPKVVNEWGVQGNREWGIGLLMHFGMGPVLAGRLYDEFGGVPLSWGINEKDAMKVPGIGKGRAEKMMRSLNGNKTGS